MDQADLPFTQEGIVPDILFTPDPNIELRFRSGS